MKAFHFICYDGQGIKKVPDSTSANTYDSGDWYLSDLTAADLIGGEIYLHESQKSPAYHAGHITDFRLTECGRKVIRYVVDKNLIGTPAPRSGWGREKCIREIVSN
jgi:hypothetical protein